MDKKNNGGFLLAETLIVSTFILSVMIILFFQFKGIIVNNKNQFLYNTVEDIYSLGSFASYLDKNDVQIDLSSENVVSIFEKGQCSISSSLKSYCTEFVNAELEAEYIYIADSDMNVIREYVEKNRSKFNQDFIDFVERVSVENYGGRQRLFAKFKNGNFATVIIPSDSSVYVVDDNNSPYLSLKTESDSKSITALISVENANDNDSIKKYYFSIDSDSDWKDSNNNRYVFNNLESNTCHYIYSKVIYESGVELYGRAKECTLGSVSAPIISIEVQDSVLDEKYLNGKPTGKNYDYYKYLLLKAKVSDSDGILNLKYCITNTNTCSPDKKLDLSFNTAYVPVGSASAGQTLCLNATDNSGESTESCSDIYKVDAEVPTLNDAKVYSDGYDVVVTLHDDNNVSYYNDKYTNLRFDYRLIPSGTSSDQVNDLPLISSSNDNYVFVNVGTGDYKVQIKAIDEAGNESEAIYKDVTVRDDSICSNIKNISDCVIANEAGTKNVTEAKQIIQNKNEPQLNTISPYIPYYDSTSYDLKSYETDSYVYLARSYNFSTTTGYYELNLDEYNNPVDPTNVDYNGDTKYYTCINPLNNQSDRTCNILLEIRSASSNSSGYKLDVFEHKPIAGIPDYSSNGMYSTIDYDNKNTYYFRGASSGNYVNFADKYWRIIRVNGDGNLRLIYDGVTAHENGVASSDKQVTNILFNKYNADNAYAGYMYGDVSGFESEPTSVKSYFKTTIDPNANYYFAKNIVYNKDGKLDDPNYEQYGVYTLSGEFLDKFNSSNSKVGLYTCLEPNKKDCLYPYKIKEVLDNNQINVEFEYSYYWENVSVVNNFCFGSSYKFDKDNRRFTIDGSISCETISKHKTDNHENYYTCLSDSKNYPCEKLLKVIKIASSNSIRVIPIEYSSTSYDIHRNDVPSVVKTYLEGSGGTDKGWFGSNLEKYKSALATNSIFCNYRTPQPFMDITYTNSAFGGIPTMYKYMNLLYPFYYQNNAYIMDTYFKVSLECDRVLDRFSVDNGYLSAPVGLITADEVTLAGGSGLAVNEKYYLYSGDNYWTMTPSDFGYSGEIETMYVKSDGSLDKIINNIFPYGVRPVINIDPNKVTYYGSGKIDDPYVIKLK